MNELKREKEKLKSVLKVYREVIISSQKSLDSLPDMYKEDPVMMYNLSKLYVTKMESLRRNYEKPYFARIDFNIDGEKEDKECYLGKVGVIDDKNNIVTIDWRAPIASVYYDSSLGRASYEAPEGIITGNLNLKRQYDIENGELLDFRDVDLVSTDEILAPYLGSNADNRLKNIVASIQSEQNSIIREKINKNLIIQGVAGSGKTTVALHRIAYLVYNYIKDIMPEQYMVIGPNKFFVNYISSVLPDLDVTNVSQLTYDEVVNNILNENFKYVSSNAKSDEKYKQINQLYRKTKGKMVFKKAIDKYAKEYIENIFGGSDLDVDGYILVKGSIINKIYETVKNDFLYKENLNKQIDRVTLLVSKYIEDNFSSINHNLWNQYTNKSKNISDIDKKDELKKYNNAKAQLEKKCKSALKKYFKKSNPKIIPLYSDFLKNLEKYIDCNVDQFSVVIEEDIKKLKSKKVEFEDLAPLLYLKSSIRNVKEYEELRHVVIDEAQDLGEFSFYALKKVMPKATFSIFGDLAQSIYQYRSIDNWSDVKEKTFDNNCEVKYLLKSYRNTYEIIDSANKVVDHIGMKEAIPVIRHGQEVVYDGNVKDYTKVIVDFINTSKEKNYKSTAIITKTDEEAKGIYKKMLKNNIAINLIDSKNTKYNGGICILPCYLAKGLEFDNVLISDASEEMYNSKNINDMKLLYVAMTRALHELTIMYDGEITAPLKNDKLVEEKYGIRKK